MSSSQSSGTESGPLTALERALKRSLLTSEFRDVHLYAFTRRTIFSDGTSRVSHPLAVASMRSVLEETEYFRKLFTSGFAEHCAVASKTSTFIRQEALQDEYDYDSDSDLDEFEEPCGAQADTASDTSASLTATCPPESIEESKNGDTAESDRDRTQPMEPCGQGRGASSDVLLPNIAYPTPSTSLRACIFYLYTNRLHFMPLRSEGASVRETRTAHR
ncbi:hypothetical protein OH77DRAFT_1090990 [Trametes cingulata]|nr:hypothetical protein OH77DRAFT_1090990 [Trametes cingulata]